MRLDDLDVVLWVVLAITKAALLTAAILRGLHRRRVAFFVWIVATTLVELMGIAAYAQGGYKLYFYAYWMPAPALFLIQFPVLMECVSEVLAPLHKHGRRIGWILYAGMLLAAIGSALVAASAETHITQRISALVESLQRSTMTAWLATLLFSAVYISYRRVPWPRISAFICCGIAAMDSAALATSGYLTLVGLRNVAIVGRVEMITADVVLSTWFLYFFLFFPPKKSIRLEFAREEIARFANSSGLLPEVEQ